MKIINLTICLLFVFSIAIAVSGCSRSRTFYTPGGKATVTDKNGKAQKVEIQSDKGKTTASVEKKTVTEAELGVPVYPGAVQEFEGSYESNESGSNKATKQYLLTTPDDFEKVFEFYKSNLKNVKNSFNQSANDQKMAIFTLKGTDDSDISVTLTRGSSKDVTNIQVIRATKQ
jgi:hypothetical protein